MTNIPLPLFHARDLPPSPLKGALTPLVDPQDGEPIALLRCLQVDGTVVTETSTFYIQIFGQSGINSISFLGSPHIKKIAWPILEATQEPQFQKEIHALAQKMSQPLSLELQHYHGTEKPPVVTYMVHETELGALITSDDPDRTINSVIAKEKPDISTHVSFLWRSQQSNHARLTDMAKLKGIVFYANQYLETMMVPSSALRFTMPDIE